MYLILFLRVAPCALVIIVVVNIRIGLLYLYTNIRFPVVIGGADAIVFKVGTQAISAFITLLIIGNERVGEVNISAKNGGHVTYPVANFPLVYQTTHSHLSADANTLCQSTW